MKEEVRINIGILLQLIKEAPNRYMKCKYLDDLVYILSELDPKERKEIEDKLKQVFKMKCCL